LGAGRLVTECRYVSIAECAEVLGVSERLIYELVAGARSSPARPSTSSKSVRSRDSIPTVS
jgi:predicted DNA-binding transcriptional regulator AlpA